MRSGPNRIWAWLGAPLILVLWLLAAPLAAQEVALVHLIEDDVRHAVQHGVADAALAGGSEACITLGTWKAWEALRVLSPEPCSPFSLGRKGMTLGELCQDGPLHARDALTTILRVTQAVEHAHGQARACTRTRRHESSTRHVRASSFSASGSSFSAVHPKPSTVVINCLNFASKFGYQV